MTGSACSIHPYGPHVSHTNSADVFEYFPRFTQWRPHQRRVLASVNGQWLPTPINLDTARRLHGLSLTSFELDAFFAQHAETVATVRTLEDVVVGRVGRDRYSKFFRSHTGKEWGPDPSELDATVIARVSSRTNRDDRYFNDVHQATPLHGYTRLFQNLLAHPNIKVMLNTDYRDFAHVLPCKHTVYTGPVDAFFDHKHGRLSYRSLHFEHVTEPAPRGGECLQPVGTVNHPNDHGYTRVKKFKHLLGQRYAASLLVYEYPRAESDPTIPCRALRTPRCCDVMKPKPKPKPSSCRMGQVVARSLMAFKGSVPS